MANKIETITTFTGLASLYETKNFEMIGKVIYETLAAANGTTPKEERAKILSPLPEIE